MRVAQQFHVASSVLPVERGIYSVQTLTRFPELLHGISTRTSPDKGDWNLSGRRGSPAHPPDPQQALYNRGLLAARLAVSLHKMVGCQQVHGSRVAVVTSADGGRGMSADVPAMLGADAMITDVPGMYLLALSADCPPVFLYDSVRRVVGLAHSGWKGTVARIAGKTTESMCAFGCAPSDIVAVVGPGIGPCCYAVGPDVIQAVESAFGSRGAEKSGELPHAALLQTRAGQTYFNLWGGIRRSLLDVGVHPENIHTEGVCTAHNVDTFYSHRGEHGQCGLFGAVLGLRDE